MKNDMPRCPFVLLVFFVLLLWDYMYVTRGDSEKSCHKLRVLYI